MPRWKPIEMTLHRLCSGELDNTLKLEVYGELMRYKTRRV
eukprot:SAG11_NODE_548_length_8594_cov_5.298293_3_plen_40_part_00